MKGELIISAFQKPEAYCIPYVLFYDQQAFYRTAHAISDTSFRFFDNKEVSLWKQNTETYDERYSEV